MKKIQFIRHSKLAHPYNDYSLLSFSEISGLATERVSPDIHPDSQKMLFAKFDTNKLNSFDLILCSHSNRTEQTAELIRKLADKDLEIRKTDNLSEIFFDPEILTNHEEFAKQGLVAIRTSLFRGMRGSIGAESLDMVLLRAKKLKNELLSLPYNNILCITHSFYMRVLRLFFLEKLSKSGDINARKLLNTIDHHYLEGFEIRL